MDGVTAFLIYIIIAFIVVRIFISIKNKQEAERIKQAVLKQYEESRKRAEIDKKRKQEFLAGFSEWSAKEFLNKKKSIGEITGVYILYNKTKNMHYVGQSVKAVQRVNNHLSGRGNGDVYADYKYGDEFAVKIIPLNKSGYSTLDKLERDMISTYNAYSRGYNKTRGNTVRS